MHRPTTQFICVPFSPQSCCLERAARRRPGQQHQIVKKLPLKAADDGTTSLSTLSHTSLHRRATHAPFWTPRLRVVGDIPDTPGVHGWPWLWIWASDSSVKVGGQGCRVRFADSQGESTIAPAEPRIDYYLCYYLVFVQRQSKSTSLLTRKRTRLWPPFRERRLNISL